MKKFITPSYTFTPGASGVGTVDLSGIGSFDKKNLVAIINQTLGVVIYATGNAATRYTNVTGTTVTLFYDTSTHSNTDTLQVIYEDNTTAQPVIQGANTNGSLASGSISAVTSELAPVNAVGFMIQALDTNTANLRFAIGATASASNGIQLQAGRSEQLNIAATISICPESGTQGYVILWSKSS